MLDAISSWWRGSPVPEAKPFDPTDPKQNPLNPKGLKPCCACPETKSARDDCFLKHEGDHDDATEACKELVASHLKCMRGYGFNI